MRSWAPLISALSPSCLNKAWITWKTCTWFQTLDVHYHHKHSHRLNAIDRAIMQWLLICAWSDPLSTRTFLISPWCFAAMSANVLHFASPPSTRYLRLPDLHSIFESASSPPLPFLNTSGGCPVRFREVLTSELYSISSEYRINCGFDAVRSQALRSASHRREFFAWDHWAHQLWPIGHPQGMLSFGIGQ